MRPPHSEETLRVALKILGGMYPVPLASEERKLLGCLPSDDERDLCRRAENVLADMIIGLYRRESH